MNEANALKLMESLGVGNAIVHGEWLRCSCPLAFNRHKSGKDSNPSFGVHISPSGRSGYLCYSCNVRSRDLADLLVDIAYALKAPAHPPPDMNLTRAQEILDAEGAADYVVSEWTLHPPKQEFVELPDWWLDSFPPVFKFPDAMAYLNKRGVPPSLWADLNLRFDTGRKMVTFPFYNIAGKLAGMRGRSITVSGNYAHHDYSWNHHNNTKLVLMNENNVDWMQSVVVVEGEFDLCKVAQVYPNVVANLTATLSEPKLQTLELAAGIIGFFDNDAAGQIASDLMKRRFGYAYRAVDYGNLQVKDAGDMTLQQIQEVLGV